MSGGVDAHSRPLLVSFTLWNGFHTPFLSLHDSYFRVLSVDPRSDTRGRIIPSSWRPVAFSFSFSLFIYLFSVGIDRISWFGLVKVRYSHALQMEVGVKKC